MGAFLKSILGFFSIYALAFEKKVDKFFESISDKSSSALVSSRLKLLMQENLVVVNLWMERKYKGYKYLKKSVRKQMYEDSSKIISRFEDEINLKFIREEEIADFLKKLNFKFPYKGDERLIFLYAIMQFLRPGKYYKYIKTASFGKLLRDPELYKLEGDCNQIVTLYIYLYAQKYDISDLKIKLLKDHVCLNYKGLDIEATTGEFKKYTDYEYLLPITEIISTNLLDLSDFRESVQNLSSKMLLKSAFLAKAISSLKKVVENNLRVAYHNLALEFLKNHKFKKAEFYFKILKDKESLHSVWRNAVNFYMKKNNFSKALFYGKKTQDKDLLVLIMRNNGLYLYRKNKFSKALKIFNKIGDKDLQKAVYSKKYNKLLDIVRHDKTLLDIKKHKSYYLKMRDLAYKLDNRDIIQSVENTLKQI